MTTSELISKGLLIPDVRHYENRRIANLGKEKNRPTNFGPKDSRETSSASRKETNVAVTLKMPGLNKVKLRLTEAETQILSLNEQIDRIWKSINDGS